MRILIIIKGGSSQVEGEVPQGNLEELKKFLDADKSGFFIVTGATGPQIVNKSSIGYILRKL